MKAGIYDIIDKARIGVSNGGRKPVWTFCPAGRISLHPDDGILQTTSDETVWKHTYLIHVNKKFYKCSEAWRNFDSVFKSRKMNKWIYIYIKEIIKKIYIGKNRKEIFWVSSVVRVVFLRLGIFWNKRIPGMSLLFTNEVVISVNLPQCLGFRSQKGGRIWLFREYIQCTTKSSK